MEPDLEHERGTEQPFARGTRPSRAPWDPPPRPARSERRRNPDRPFDDDDMRRGTD
jgi:hypothetical protein